MGNRPRWDCSRRYVDVSRARVTIDRSVASTKHLTSHASTMGHPSATFCQYTTGGFSVQQSYAMTTIPLAGLRQTRSDQRYAAFEFFQKYFSVAD